MKKIAVILLLFLMISSKGFVEEAFLFHLIPIDPLIKIFQDDSYFPVSPPIAHAARGEHATFQCVVYTEENALKNLHCKVAPFQKRFGKESFNTGHPRFMGYVPVEKSAKRPAKDMLRMPPAQYPDPLLETDSLELQAGRTQAIWVTVPVPLECTPGTYRAWLDVSADDAAGNTKTVSLYLKLKVYKAKIEESPLWVTEWFNMRWPFGEDKLEPHSEKYYDILRRYARNMAEHRHNVALISSLHLAQYGVDDAGELSIDFSRFDRWVEIFLEEGVIGRIEGGHIGGRKAGWDSEFVVSIREVKDGKVSGRSVDPGDPAAEVFYSRFFPALVAHLKEKGWLECYMQHLADEPTGINLETYRAMAKLARDYAPELRIMEACHSKDLTGAMDIWVPQLNYYQRDIAHYQARQAAGDEVWFYTCLYPQGEYANRFLEQPLIKTRLLHWINFRYGATGYLHWGWNQWNYGDPYANMTPDHGSTHLPAGDAHIVYPGPDGPIDSIRYEAMRDGIADYALLHQAAQIDPDKAQEFAKRHILDFDEYETSVTEFRKTRKELLKWLSRRTK